MILSPLLAVLGALPLAMGASPNGRSPNALVQFVPFLLILVIFYVLILRPQSKRQKQHQKMLSELQKGDRILTNGGLYANVLNVKDSVIVASIADGVKVEISKSAVAARVKAKK